MKLSVVILFLLMELFYATESYGQSDLLSFEVKNETVQHVLDKIETQTDLRFFYNNKQVNTQRIISLKSDKRTVFSLLEELFKDTDICYSVIDKNIILSKKENKDSFASLISKAETGKMISGTVVDVAGVPVIGTNVVVKGSAQGVTTDIDGNFRIVVPQKATIQISYLGYLTEEFPVTLKSVYNVVLKEDVKKLGEVIVTAFGIKREEKALGYAVQKIDGNHLSAVKNVNVGTSLTGKISGLNVLNSTEFNAPPTLILRGERPLLVIDGISYRNMSLEDVAPDDIESVDILKGATASALYGARGGSGAIMITTKRGNIEGLHINVNSSTMFASGYLKRPEVQTSYSSGSGGRYAVGDYVWGDRLDIGRMAEQYNPYTHQTEYAPLVSKGKDNLKNFSQLSLITNNNISVSQKGKYGSVRTSLTHVYNKGQYPNTRLNKFTYTVSGDINWKDFTFEGGLTYNKRYHPTDMGSGYQGGGFLYNLLVWSGTEYDIRDYKDYWIIPDEKQNWMDTTWYDNPYFIANEITASSDYDVLNGFLSATYNITSGLKLFLRSGVDSYSYKEEWQNPVNALGGWHKKGYYGIRRSGGYSLNNDALLMADCSFGNFMLDGFIGGSIYYYQNDNMLSETQNGLSIPGYYSLKASVDPVKASSGVSRKQVNSISGKVSASWKSTLFADITARNDWSSTLEKQTRSYFYPSVAGSVVLSQFIPMPVCVDFWKMRASWTKTKNDIGVYATNKSYYIATNVWDGLNSATYPTSIRDAVVKPSESCSYEVGTAFTLFKNRLRIDAAYYNKLQYNLTREAGVSSATGFGSTLINIEEEQVRRGGEFTLSGDIFKTKDFEWGTVFNWSLDRFYYAKVDPVYSTQYSWVAAGKRWDWIDNVYDYKRDTEGNIIHKNGYPEFNEYKSVPGYSDPDWIWGLTNVVRYKDFTFSFTLDGRVGGIAHSVTDQALWNSGSHIESDNQWRYDEVVNGNKNYVGQGVKVISGSEDYDSDGNIIRDNRVFAPNDVGVSYETYMLVCNPYVGTIRSQHLLDQTFFKLRNLSVSYSLPRNVCDKLRLRGATIGFIGQNLLIWTKEFNYSDPDNAVDNLNSPSLRYMGFNIKLDL